MSARAGCAVRRVDVRGSTRPPVVLVHGAANSAGVWTFWQDELARTGWPATRYRTLPVPADLASVEGASHWGLVLGRTSVAAGAEIVGAWLDRALGRTSA